MADVPNGGASSTHNVSISFNREVLKLATLLLSTSQQHRFFRGQMEVKRITYVKLCAEQLNICESINKYNKAWLEHALEHVDSYDRNTLNTEVKAHMRTLETWRAKLDACKEKFTSYFRRLKKHDADTKIAMEKLKAAKTLTELGNIDLPNIGWTMHVVDPGVEQLRDEWDRLGLESKIRGCLLKMQQLIESEGQNVRSL